MTRKEWQDKYDKCEAAFERLYDCIGPGTLWGRDPSVHVEKAIDRLRRERRKADWHRQAMDLLIDALTAKPDDKRDESLWAMLAEFAPVEHGRLLRTGRKGASIPVESLAAAIKEMQSSGRWEAWLDAQRAKAVNAQSEWLRRAMASQWYVPAQT